MSYTPRRAAVKREITHVGDCDRTHEVETVRLRLVARGCPTRTRRLIQHYQRLERAGQISIISLTDDVARIRVHAASLARAFGCAQTERVAS